MINNFNTNLLYLSDLLPKRHPKFYKIFSEILDQNKIEHHLLRGTKDIWARDYMPIQFSDHSFTAFKYAPSYLNTKTLKATITNPHSVCKDLQFKIENSNVKLDGGNVVSYMNKAILCDRVVAENPGYTIKELTEELRWGLRTNNIIYIPTPEDDIFGHVDGLVRFIDKKNVLINDYGDEDKVYEKQLRSALTKAGFNIHTLPYNPYGNKSYMDATGVYINFLHMKGIIFLPVFGFPEDELAMVKLKSIFKEKIVPVPSNEIAKKGGVLNCISWNISKPITPYDDLTKEIDRDILCLGLE